jgi:altronate dehydratase
MGTVKSPEAVLQLHPGDPVAVARRDLEVGTEFESGGHRVVLRDAVPRGHKVALVALSQGAAVHKYGQLIGIARCPITAGEHVHGHNLVSPSRAGASALASPPSNPESEPTVAGDFAAPTPAEPSGAVGDTRTFAGIVRPDGRVGTRNYLAVLSSVNCSATVVKRIAAAFSAPGALDGYPGVDGVIAITHGGGCGLAGEGEGLELLRRTLAGYARHPNVAGVVVVGLGCEVNQVSALVDQFHLPEGTLVQNLTIQHLGGSIATVHEGIALRAVHRYSEPVTSSGLVFMDTPGYDPVSVAGIVAGGANVVCFTTGRGSVFGCKPAPSLKLATTSELYRRMGDDMDFNCGPVLDGDASVKELGEALFEAILAVASGRHTKSEDLGFGDEEFTPWQLGAVM